LEKRTRSREREREKWREIETGEKENVVGSVPLNVKILLQPESLYAAVHAGSFLIYHYEPL